MPELAAHLERVAKARQEIITNAMVLENLGIYVDWMKLAERLAKVEAMYGCERTGR